MARLTSRVRLAAKKTKEKVKEKHRKQKEREPGQRPRAPADSGGDTQQDSSSQESSSDASDGSQRTPAPRSIQRAQKDTGTTGTADTDSTSTSREQQVNRAQKDTGTQTTKAQPKDVEGGERVDAPDLERSVGSPRGPAARTGLGDTTPADETNEEATGTTPEDLAESTVSGIEGVAGETTEGGTLGGLGQQFVNQANLQSLEDTAAQFQSSVKQGDWMGATGDAVRLGTDALLDNPVFSVQDTVRGVATAPWPGKSDTEVAEGFQSGWQGFQQSAVKFVEQPVDEALSGTAADNKYTDFVADVGTDFAPEVVKELPEGASKLTTGIDLETGGTEGTAGFWETFDVATLGGGKLLSTAADAATFGDEAIAAGDEAVAAGDEATGAPTTSAATSTTMPFGFSAADEVIGSVDELTRTVEDAPSSAGVDESFTASTRTSFEESTFTLPDNSEDLARTLDEPASTTELDEGLGAVDETTDGISDELFANTPEPDSGTVDEAIQSAGRTVDESTEVDEQVSSVFDETVQTAEDAASTSDETGSAVDDAVEEASDDTESIDPFGILSASDETAEPGPLAQRLDDFLRGSDEAVSGTDEAVETADETADEVPDAISVFDETGSTSDEAASATDETVSITDETTSTTDETTTTTTPDEGTDETSGGLFNLGTRGKVAGGLLGGVGLTIGGATIAQKLKNPPRQTTVNGTVYEKVHEFSSGALIYEVRRNQNSLGYAVIVGVNDSGNLVVLNRDGSKRTSSVSRREFKKGVARGGS